MKKSKKFKFVAKKNYAEEVVSLTPGQLRKAVRAFQKGDAEAAECLRKSYFPLVYSIAHRESIYSILGEDAENEVWIIFFNLIKAYKGTKFRTFPTSIKMLLELRLVDITKQHFAKTNNELIDSDNTLTASMPAPDVIDKSIMNMALLASLEQLSDFEKEIIEYCYFSKLTRKEIAEKLGYSERQLRRFKEDVLKSLRNKLS